MEIFTYVPSDQALVARAKPVYKTLPGWKEDITQIREYDKLPQEARDYISFIEEYVGVPVTLVSVGPDRENNIYRES